MGGQMGRTDEEQERDRDRGGWVVQIAKQITAETAGCVASPSAPSTSPA